MDHVVRQGIDERIGASCSPSRRFLTPGIDDDEIDSA